MNEETRPLNYAGLALAMIVGALGIVSINLYSARDFVEAALLKRARAHYADSLVSQRWLKHETGSRSFPLPEARSHEVRLVGIRPLASGNAPDEWEKSTLSRFASGQREAFEHFRKGDLTEFRYLGPLYVRASCLECHAGQGFKVGDVAGAISVSFDATETDQASRNNAIATVIAIVLIMVGVGQVMLFSIRRVRELGRITDRERERFESLVQAIDGIVWEADPVTLRFSFVSRHAQDLFGYPLKDWLQEGFWTKHLHPEDRDRFILLRGRGAQRTEASELDYRFMTSDGRTLWLHDRASLVVSDGKRRVLRGIMIDITKRKHAEKEARNLLRAVEQSPVSIVITDREGVIEYVNPRFSQLFGYTRAEAIGQTPRLLKSNDTPPAVYEDLWQTIRGGKEWRGRLKNRCKDGSEIWEDVSISPVFSDDGEITHYLGVKENVTERLRVENELARYRDTLEDQVRARTEDLMLAMQKATAADRAKSEFLTNMSHEIRTPLNAVIGFCELVLRTDLNARQRDYLDKIDAASQHLLQLINNLLDLSKIAAGRVEIAVHEFDLPRLLDRIGSVMGYRAIEKGLKFELQVDPDLPDCLLGDEMRINQVVLNLVNNAIKFTERGDVRVEVRLLHRDEGFSRVSFVITDSGIGMDAAELRRAFEPFAQADASISRKYGGTGLGLSISRDLIGLMGGVLEARSEKGRGSRFSFVLNLASVRQASGNSQPAGNLPAAVERFENLRVLLVEDQPFIRMVAGDMMSSHGVEVEMATNGREAVDCLFARGPEAFDIVLMDLQMPEFDGISAMKAIRERPQFRQLPIIAMTAHVLEEERRRAAAAGANGHLGKPFQSEQLYDMLARFAPAEKVKWFSPRLEVPAAATPDVQVSEVVLDWDDGLERFGGRADKYRGWLRRFADERRGQADEAQTLLAEGKAEQAAQQLHALKGGAGMLGLRQVFAAARELETACRELAGGQREGAAAPEVAALRKALGEAIAVIAELADEPRSA